MSERAPSPSIVDYAWGLERAWSDTADRAKLSLTRARTVTLLLLVTGAVCGAIGVYADDASWRALWAIAAAVALGVAGAMEVFAVTPEKSREWAAARMTSERLTAALWAYLARVDPYSGDEAEREAELQRAVDHIEDAAGREVARRIDPVFDDHPVVAAGTEVEAYIDGRAEDQRLYHRRNGAIEQRRGDRLRGLVFGLTIAGATLAAAGGAWPEARLGSWIATVSAATAALTTHSGAARHHEIAIGYANTANRLELALQRFRGEADPAAAFAAFVGRVEDILAVQNDLWSDVIER